MYANSSLTSTLHRTNYKHTEEVGFTMAAYDFTIRETKAGLWALSALLLLWALCDSIIQRFFFSIYLVLHT